MVFEENSDNDDDINIPNILFFWGGGGGVVVRKVLRGIIQTGYPIICHSPLHSKLCCKRCIKAIEVHLPNSFFSAKYIVRDSSSWALEQNVYIECFNDNC